MKNLRINLQDLASLIGFDFRGTSIHKELEKFFMAKVIPLIKSNPGIIKSVINQLNNNALLLFLLMREIPMKIEVVIYVTEKFFDEIQYRQGVNSYVKYLLGEFIDENNFTTELYKQINRLKEFVPKVKIQMFLLKLFTLEKGNAGFFVAKNPHFKEFFNLDMLVTLSIKLRNEGSKDLRNIVFRKISENIKNIDKDEILKERLIKSYFDETLRTFDSSNTLEEAASLLLVGCKLNRNQVLCIKKHYDKWYLSINQKKEFCNLIFNYQTSISPLETNKWLKNYREEKSKNISSARVYGRLDHC